MTVETRTTAYKKGERMARGDKPRKHKNKPRMVMSTLTLTPEHYRRLWIRKKVFGTPMSITVRTALNYYFDTIEEKEINDYLNQWKE